LKVVILVLLIVVVASLASGLYFLSRDASQPGGSSRVLKALKVRVALSVLLIIVLVSSYFLGWINPPGYIQ
jgi:hypothetical protein